MSSPESQKRPHLSFEPYQPTYSYHQQASPQADLNGLSDLQLASHHNSPNTTPIELDHRSQLTPPSFVFIPSTSPMEEDTQLQFQQLQHRADMETHEGTQHQSKKKFTMGWRADCEKCQQRVVSSQPLLGLD